MNVVLIITIVTLTLFVQIILVRSRVPVKQAILEMEHLAQVRTDYLSSQGG